MSTYILTHTHSHIYIYIYIHTYIFNKESWWLSQAEGLGFVKPAKEKEILVVKIQQFKGLS